MTSGVGPVGLPQLDLPEGWMRQIVEASPRRLMQPRKGCVGHFFDPNTRRIVDVPLGEVWARPVPVFRAAPSVVFDDEPENILSWVGERAAQSTEQMFCESAEKVRVSPVIPGQTLMGES